MAIQANKHYLGVRMGATSAGLPLYAIHDPCDTGLVGRVGIPVGATSAGLPLYAHKGCGTAAPAVNSTYAAVLMGATSAGLPLYAVPCNSCGPPPPVPCTGTTTIRINVFGCGNLGLTGASIKLSKGDWSETKPVTGGGTMFVPSFAIFDVTSQGAGTYTYEVSHPRFSSYTSTITIACNTATTAPSVQMAVLNVLPDYICTPLCPYPIRKTLYATNTFGTFALVWDGNPNESFNWWGCQIANVDSREIGQCGASAFCRGQGANAGTPVLYKFDGSSVTAYWYCTRLCADDGKVYRANIDCWTGSPSCFDGGHPSAISNLATSSADCAGWSFTGNFDALADGDCSIPGVPGSGGSSGTILASPLVITE